MKKKCRTLLIWGGLVAVLLFLFAQSDSDRPSTREPFDQFVQDVRQGRVLEVQVNDNEITVWLNDTDEDYFTLGVVDDELTRELSEQGVRVTSGKPSRTLWSPFIIGAIVLIFLIVFLFRIIRRSGGIGDFMQLSKSRARPLPESSKVTFADVGGCEEAKLLLGDLIDFLKNPQRWIDAGVRLPRGVLLEGPPGCGKTLLARAVAGETDAKFFFISASEFVEMFVGVGAARVRDMFETAVKEAPAVIFIDELDAVGRRRGSGIGAGHDEREQTLNQLLTCLDGVEHDKPLVVIAATNRPDILDQALVRPGRMDRRIRIAAPSRDARLEILEIHAADKSVASDVSWQRLAEEAEGLNGAQLDCLVNEAALLAVRRTRGHDAEQVVIGMADLHQALDCLTSREQIFNQLDSVLIESASQVAEPTGRAVVRLTLENEAAVEGELIWADGTFMKVRNGEKDIIVSKSQVKRIEALSGTESTDRADMVPDDWARHLPDLA